MFSSSQLTMKKFNKLLKILFIIIKIFIQRQINFNAHLFSS